MAKQFKKRAFVTPPVAAIWPKLTEPDTKFKAEGEYAVKFDLTKAQAAPILALIDEAKKDAEDMYREAKKNSKAKVIWQDMPFKEVDDEDNPGVYRFNVKSKASYTSKRSGKTIELRPTLVDAKRRDIDPESIQIWNGSILKVAGEVEPYYAGGKAGVTLRLNGAQILKLVSGARDAASLGFEEEEDGFEYDNASKPAKSKPKDEDLDEEVAEEAGEDAGQEDF